MKLKTKPYRHQMEELRRTIDKPAYAHLWDMRTGKTKLIIDIASNLFIAGKIDAVFVVAPNNVHMNWVDPEIIIHSPVDYSAIAWDGKKKTKKYKQELVKTFNGDGLIWFTMNYEALPTTRGYEIAKYYLTRFRTLFVLDESHRIKNISAKRSKRLDKLGAFAVRKRILTGTPITKNLLDLYNQFNWLDPKILYYSSFYGFKAHYAEIEKVYMNKKTKKYPNGWKFEKVTGFKNVNELRKKIAPYSTRIKKEDCLDLPDKIFSRLPVQLSSKQKEVYNTIKQQLQIELEMTGVEFDREISNIFSQTVTCKISLTKLLRLRQVISNFVTSDSGEDIVLGKSNPKLEALIDDLQDSFDMFDNKIVIWAVFHYEIELITTTLKKLYGKNVVEAYYGKTPQRQKTLLKKTFQDTDPDQPGKVYKKSPLRILVSNPASGGIGLDFSRASIVYYFSNSYDAEHRWQSEERTHGPGSKHNVLYKDIVAVGTIDVEVHRSLTEKARLSAAVIDC